MPRTKKVTSEFNNTKYTLEIIPFVLYDTFQINSEEHKFFKFNNGKTNLNFPLSYPQNFYIYGISCHILGNVAKEECDLIDKLTVELVISHKPYLNVPFKVIHFKEIGIEQLQECYAKLRESKKKPEELKKDLKYRDFYPLDMKQMSDESDKEDCIFLPSNTDFYVEISRIDIATSPEILVVLHGLLERPVM